tara:strand:- start:1766 stop:2563 length:798 start_codon:yes stop_codon:yes gene_type:complete
MSDLTNINDLNEKLSRLNEDFKIQQTITENTMNFKTMNQDYKYSLDEIKKKMDEDINNQNQYNQRYNNFFTDTSIYDNKPNIDFLEKTYQNTNNINYVSSDINNPDLNQIQNPNNNNTLKRDNRDIHNRNWENLHKKEHQQTINQSQLDFLNSLHKTENNNKKNEIFASSNQKFNNLLPITKTTNNVKEQVAFDRNLNPINNQSNKFKSTIKEIQNQRLCNLKSLPRNINLPVNKTNYVQSNDKLPPPENTQSQEHLNKSFKILN